MSDARDDGGPAFPVIGAAGLLDDYGGMSLHDYFAAKAMQGLVIAASNNASWSRDIDQWAPGKAYEIADAMIEARQS
jgi:hypothetical protein